MMLTFICTLTDCIEARKEIAFLVLNKDWDKLCDLYDGEFVLYDGEQVEDAARAAKRDGWIPNDIWVFRPKAFWTEEVEISAEEAAIYGDAAWQADGKWYLEVDCDGVVVG